MKLRVFTWIAAASVACLGLLQASAGCSTSSSTGGSGGSAQDPCFDYSTFQPPTAAVSFKDDVQPIFRRACGLSSDCHGSPAATIPNQPYLGPALTDPAPTSEDLAKIIAGIVNVVGQVPSPNGSSQPVAGDLKIVDPGSPETSFMMFKLDAVLRTATETADTFCSTLACASGDQCGASMPEFSPSLSSDERDTIRGWIAQGAKND